MLTNVGYDLSENDKAGYWLSDNDKAGYWYWMSSSTIIINQIITKLMLGTVD